MSALFYLDGSSQIDGKSSQIAGIDNRGMTTTRRTGACCWRAFTAGRLAAPTGTGRGVQADCCRLKRAQPGKPY